MNNTELRESAVFIMSTVYCDVPLDCLQYNELYEYVVSLLEAWRAV